MQTVLITGGTGMIGKRLTWLLTAKGYNVIILTRNKELKDNASEKTSYAHWDIGKQFIDPVAVSQADHVIHLAGAGVADKRWSNKRKTEIRDSRTQSSALIVKALNELPNKVQSVISASGIGWYGADTTFSRKHGFTEDIPADTEFLGETCRLWEESIEPINKMGKRLVKLRTGIVLSNEGGALVEFKKPLKTGIAAILGGGEQMISWIHIDDLCMLFVYAIENASMKGAYNAVAPNPVSNKELTLQLAKKIRGSFFIPVHVPAFLLKLVLGEMSVEVLKSATVNAQKVQETGFLFYLPDIDLALTELIG